MQYRKNPKNGDMLSILGFGCMRFPRSFEETRALVERAVENGINYFDTAYIYPNNEVTLGRAIEGLRDKVKLATKLPPMGVKKYEDFDRIFNTQLERLRTDRIDYYLIHMLSDVKAWERLVALGIIDWIAEQKRLGRILNLGFSYHGGRDEFVRVVDAYDWDFCMIQYNYLDENNQAGKSGLLYAASKGLPVMIMEPLRGGRLATGIPREAAQAFAEAKPSRTPAQWGLSWIWSHPEVCTVLSGMNSRHVLEENLAAASDSGVNALQPGEQEMFDSVRRIFTDKMKVSCTGCNYCVPCPSGVDIPTCFSCYNEIKTNGYISALQHYIMQTGFKRQTTNASQCIQCGKCEAHCPQGIEIRRELKNVSRELERVVYKPVSAVARRFMRLTK